MDRSTTPALIRALTPTPDKVQEASFRLGYAAMGANSTRAFKALGRVSCRVAW
jgi:hypothetical protein